MIITAILVGACGALLIVLGYLIWVKEKISLLHDYHYVRVRPEDRAVYCRVAGIGVLTIGVGLLVTAVLLAFTRSPLGFIAFGVGFILGLALLVYAGRRYNGGFL